MLLTTVVFGIPFNYIMTFTVGLGITGMLIAQITSISLFFCVTSLTVRRINYKFECERAAKRIKEDLEIMRSEETKESERRSAEKKKLLENDENADEKALLTDEASDDEDPNVETTQGDLNILPSTKLDALQQ